MSGRPKAVEARRLRLATVMVVWLAGLVAGFLGFLGAVARYGCTDGDDGMACRTSGSLVGWLIVIAVIVVVTTVTVMSAQRGKRGVVTVGGAGLAVLVCCLVAAGSLLGTA